MRTGAGSLTLTDKPQAPKEKGQSLFLEGTIWGAGMTMNNLFKFKDFTGLSLANLNQA